MQLSERNIGEMKSSLKVVQTSLIMLGHTTIKYILMVRN
jgi:hypothetical protein